MISDGIFAQKLSQKTLRRLRISVPLEQDIQHEAVLVYRPPEPVSNAIDGRTHVVQKPAGTPSGFPLTQTICEECAELDAPFAQGFVTHLDAALVQQFLNAAVAEREAVVQPNGVLNDGHDEAMAVGLSVGHGQSAYPEPVKATQPTEVLPGF